MRLVGVERITEGDRVVLIGRIDRGDRVDSLFFRFPADVAGSAPPNADPFFTALLVPALFASEPLIVDPPVSPRLLRGSHRVQDILTTWYASRPRIEVVATPRTVDGASTRGTGVGAFFSGGVDSSYTLLKSRLGLPSLADPITHLIFVKGFDAPLSEAQSLAESERLLRATATRHGCTLVAVETNLREVVPAPWGEMQCGSALAAVGLALGALRTVLIPSTYGYDDLVPHGSHPLLDEAWSTETTQFVHDGCESQRVAKLAALIQHAPDMANQLRVCWESGKGGPINCGHCGKCVRTMAALQALGRLGATTSLPDRLPPDYALAFSLDHRVTLAEVIEQARRIGDKDMVRRLRRQQRAMDLKDGLRRALRALPLTEALLDARASLVRRWRRR